MGTKAAVIYPEPQPSALPRAEQFTRDGVARLETTTLLPGGSLATLTLRRSGESYQVDDEGNGRAAILALGVQHLSGADVRRGSDIAQALGLTFIDDTFFLTSVSAGQLPAAVAYVAEASRSWAAATIDAHRRTRGRDIAGRAAERLRTLLPTAEVQVERELAGASTKLHRFDVVVSLPDGRFAAFESLLPAQVSIAAAHLKFYDLKQAHRNWRREAVVEDLSMWPASDLAMIQQVASGVRDIEAAWDDLTVLAA